MMNKMMSNMMSKMLKNMSQEDMMAMAQRVAPQMGSMDQDEMMKSALKNLPIMLENYLASASDEERKEIIADYKRMIENLERKYLAD